MRDDFLKIVGSIVLGLVILMGTLAGFQMLSISPLWSDSGVAWVQAIGSIGAILATGLIANWQYRKSTEGLIAQHRRELLVPAVAILTLMRELEFEGNRGVTALEQMLANGKQERWDKTFYLEGLEASFRAIPLWQLPSPELVRDVTAIIRFIPRKRDQLQSVFGGMSYAGWRYQEWSVSLSSVRTELRVWVETFEGHVTALGGDPNTGTHWSVN